MDEVRATVSSPIIWFLTFDSMNMTATLTGWQEIKAHPWFAPIDWDKLAAKKVTPPITPDPNKANCTSTADLQVCCNKRFLDQLCCYLLVMTCHVIAIGSING
jgi:hypothetical protein